MTTLDTLNVKIVADISNLQGKLADLKKQLNDSRKYVNSLKDKIKELEAMGTSRTQQAYKDLVKELREAEEAQSDLNYQVGLYTVALKKKRQQERELDGSLTSAEGKTMDLGAAFAKVAGKASAFAAVLSLVKKGIDGFVEDNPNSGLAQFINKIKDLGTQFRDLLLMPINYPFEQAFGKTSTVKVELKEINAELLDFTKYYKLLNKEIERNKFLMSGFDELNIISKKQNGNKNQEAVNELTERYLDLKEKQKEIEKDISDIWAKFAKELDISVADYQELYRLWAGGETQKAKDLANELGLDNWETVVNNLKNFAENGMPKIKDLQQEWKNLGDQIERVKRLIDQLGGNSKNLPGGRRTVPLDNDIEERNNGNPSTWKGKVKTEDTTWQDYANIGMWNMGVYAEGGVLTSPTVGLMAEYPGASTNPEIVTPQSLMLETMQEANGMLADVVAQAAGQVVAAIANQNLEVSIGDDVIAASAARGNRNYFQMTGGHLL